MCQTLRSLVKLQLLLLVIAANVKYRVKILGLCLLHASDALVQYLLCFCTATTA